MKKLGALAVVTALGCSTSAEGPLTWEEFRDQTYQEPDTGIYITNGDEPADSLDELREVYDRFLASYEEAQLPADVRSTEEYSIVNVVNGRDDVWDSATAQNLTYCVSTKFGSNYAAIVAAMDQAAGAWEGAARVNFIHDASKDGNCNARTDGVVFDVAPARGCQYYARAFFPSDRRRSRELLFAGCAFGDPVWTVAGILRHELGHTIGLRHEHTRPESGTCFEDNNWRALTAYDSASVMHYPQCNGSNTHDLDLTSSDRSGASQLYP